jgi:hypothetical protein
MVIVLPSLLHNNGTGTTDPFCFPWNVFAEMYCSTASFLSEVNVARDISEPERRKDRASVLQTFRFSVRHRPWKYYMFATAFLSLSTLC